MTHDTGPEPTVQLNVRVKREIVDLLQAAAVQENARLSDEGRTERVTKRSLIEHAILKTYGELKTDEHRI